MKKRLGILLAGMFLVSVSMASIVTAGPGHAPEATPGNYQCAEGDTKIDPVLSGTYALVGGGSVTITVSWGSYGTYSGWVFSFDTGGSATVSAIVVKGGPNYHTYIFAPAVESAAGLHAPVNPNNKNLRWYGLSHLCITSDEKK